MFEKHGVQLNSLSYIFCTDEYLLSINKEFLNHPNFTDIITFDLSEKGEPTIGEIYISVERVRENAQKFKVHLNRELHRVIFHGVLHLCGYKDKTIFDKKKMRFAEDKCLKEYFGSKVTDVPRETKERKYI